MRCCCATCSRMVHPHPQPSQRHDAVGVTRCWGDATAVPLPRCRCWGAAAGVPLSQRVHL